jgi:hypothetical protein
MLSQNISPLGVPSATLRLLLHYLRSAYSAQSANGVIREANGAEFFKAHLQARLRVGLQKQRQPSLLGVPRFFSALS